MKLYCDIDGTINDFQYRWCRAIALDDLKFAKTEAEIMLDRPLPFAKESLDLFKAYGWEINFLTARGSIPKEITIKWLKENNFNYNNLYQVRTMKDKIEFLNKHKFDLFIDDFMSGQDINKPIFKSNIYEAIKRLGPVEVFRNNWQEIEGRYVTGKN